MKEYTLKMKRICFIAQFPPPIHGLSKAVETLYTSALQSKYLFQQINLTNNKRDLKNIMEDCNQYKRLILSYHKHKRVEGTGEIY